MKVYISADIEGCTGLVSWSQCGGPKAEVYDWQFARRMYTHDVNAAIRGARAGGATEILLKDSHGTMQNLLVESLEPGIQLVSGRGSGRDFMMQGIDDSFDAAMLIGYHATAGTRVGIMEHAMYGSVVHRMWINGQPAGEIGASAGIAGHYGVPIVAVSSDQAGCAEAKALLPHIATAVTKVAIGRFKARCLQPAETANLIENAAKAGVEAADRQNAWRNDGNTTFRVECQNTEQADLAELMPTVKRLDGYVLEVTGANFVEAHTAFVAMLYLAAAGAGSR